MCVYILKYTKNLPFVTFSTFTMSYNRHRCLVPEHFHHPRGNPVPSKQCEQAFWSVCPQVFSQSCCLAVRLVPMLSRYSDVVLFFLTMSLATHRSTAKLLSVLAQVFTELAQKVRIVHVVHCGAAVSNTLYPLVFDGLLFWTFTSSRRGFALPVYFLGLYLTISVTLLH